MSGRRARPDGPPARGIPRIVRKAPGGIAPDAVQRVAVSFALLSAALALTFTGLLPVVGAVPVTVVAVAGVWWSPGGRSGQRLAFATGLAAVVACGAIMLVGLLARPEPPGRAGLLVVATALVMAISALEPPTTRSLLMRSWLACGGALLAGSVSDRPVTRVCVVACIAGAALSLARWSQHSGPLPVSAGAVSAGGSAEGAEVGGGILRWSVLPSAAVVVSAVAVVLLVAGLAQQQGRQDFWSGRSSASSGGSDGGSGGGSDGSRSASERSTSAYLGGQMSLDARGDLDDAPLFRVPAADGHLWRAGVLDAYDGRSWVATGQPPEVLANEAGRAQVLDDEGPQLGGGERTSLVEVLDDSSFQVSVIAPGPVTGVSVPPTGDTVPVDPDAFDADAGSRVLLYREPEDPGVWRFYAVTWQDPDGARYSELSPQARERYTQLPATSPRVQQLSRSLVTDPSDPLAAVAAVEADLRARAAYDLDSPVAPEGADSVEDFLFRSHEGFCEHFASAEVVLLRLAGVPARIATGFVAPAPATPGGPSVITGAEAHAWVEVWVPDRGWVTTDPTAGTRQATSFEEQLRERLADLFDQIRRSPALLAAVIAVLLLLLAGAAFVGYRVRRRPSPPRPEPGLPGLPPRLAQAYRDLRLALAGAGPAPGPADGVRSVAVRAGVVAGLSTAELQALLGAVEVVERTAFAASPPIQADQDGAVTVLVAATRAVREARSGSPAAVGAGMITAGT